MKRAIIILSVILLILLVIIHDLKSMDKPQNPESESESETYDIKEDLTSETTTEIVTEKNDDSNISKTDVTFPYALKITRPDLMIYTAPGYDNADIGTLLDIGVYTITEHFVCDEGFTWGKLKSGIGWIDLDIATSEAPHIPITLELTKRKTLDSMDCHSYITEETDYTQYLCLQSYEKLTDISFCIMDLVEDYLESGEILYTLEELNTDKPLVVGVVFHGDFTTFGLSFTDSFGKKCNYIIYTSGRNGSVIMQEYDK